MKQARLSLLLLLPLLALSLPGCIEMAAVGIGAAVLSAVDRRTTGAQVEDEGVELRATNRINERFGDKVHINVTSYNRNVLLTGEVPDEKTKAEIEKIALAVPNARGVTNDLQIGGNSSFSADRKSTRLNSSHSRASRMPSSA